MRKIFLLIAFGLVCLSTSVSLVNISITSPFFSDVKQKNIEKINIQYTHNLLDPISVSYHDLQTHETRYRLVSLEAHTPETLALNNSNNALTFSVEITFKKYIEKMFVLIKNMVFS